MVTVKKVFIGIKKKKRVLRKLQFGAFLTNSKFYFYRKLKSVLLIFINLYKIPNISNFAPHKFVYNLDILFEWQILNMAC